MSKLSQKQKVSRYCMIATVAITFVYTAVLLLLFYRQYYLTNNVDYYKSDLTMHIKFGKSGESLYSLMYLCLGLLDSLPYPGVCIGVFLVLFLLFGVWATKQLIAYLRPAQDKWVVWVYAWICNMVFPLTVPYFPHFGSFDYRGLLNFNIYHNSTYIAMKPFALLAVLCFFKLMDNRYEQKRISAKEWIVFSLMMLLATAFKPNFIIGFSLTMLCVLIADFIRCRGKNILNFILVGTTVFPSAALTLYQQSQLFGESSQIKIGFLTALRAMTEHPEIPLLLSFVFPLVILAFSFRDLKSDKLYRFTWLHMLINLFMTLFLYETGKRIKHGNFLWGSYFAIGLLFIFSVCKLDGLIEKKKTACIVCGSMILGMNIFCWFNYMCDILNGNFPF